MGRLCSAQAWSPREHYWGCNHALKSPKTNTKPLKKKSKWQPKATKYPNRGAGWKHHKKMETCWKDHKKMGWRPTHILFVILVAKPVHPFIPLGIPTSQSCLFPVDAQFTAMIIGILEMMPGLLPHQWAKKHHTPCKIPSNWFMSSFKE